MQVEFKFEIGDFVASRAELETLKRVGLCVDSEFRWAVSGQLRKFHTYQVSERIMQECPGGVQIKYQVASEDLPSAVVLEQQLMPMAEAIALVEALAREIVKTKREVKWEESA